MPRQTANYSSNPQEASFTTEAIHVYGCVGALQGWSPDAAPVTAPEVHRLGCMAVVYHTETGLPVLGESSPATVFRQVKCMEEGGALAGDGSNRYSIREGAMELFASQLDPMVYVRNGFRHRTQRQVAAELGAQYCRERATGSSVDQARERILLIVSKLEGFKFLAPLPAAQ